MRMIDWACGRAAKPSECICIVGASAPTRHGGRIKIDLEGSGGGGGRAKLVPIGEPSSQKLISGKSPFDEGPTAEAGDGAKWPLGAAAEWSGARR